MSRDHFDEAVEQYHLALREFVKGNALPNHARFSHQDDVTLMNPLHPVARGWEQVAATMERAAAQLRDGDVTAFERVAEYITSDVACIVEIERYVAKLGGREDLTPFALRVTTLFRPEDGAWKVVHRHADPITTPQAIESVLPQ
jgi:ketosteroid isomerase-like protein